MIRKLTFGLALAGVAGLSLGCDSSKDTKPTVNYTEKRTDMSKNQLDNMKDATKGAIDTAKDGGKAVADKAAETAKAAMEKIKTDVVKPIEEMYPKVEEKIKALTGETGTKASAAFAAVKKLVEEFKAAPADKYKELMGGLTSKFDELKKMVGL